MNLNLNLTIDVEGLTLIDLAAMVNRIKVAVDPDNKRRLVIRQGKGKSHE
jgi:hypothetical protein